MKRIFFAVLLPVALFSGTVLVHEACSQEAFILPAGTMTLSPPENYDAKKSWVVFPHSTHFKFPCQSCHHEWVPGEEVKSCSSAGCHEEFWPEAADGKEDNLSLTAAYHRACRDCHRDELAKLDKKAKAGYKAPIACDGCHPATQGPKVNTMSDFHVPVGTITLEPPEGADAKRSSVDFPHDTHFGFACGECHHTWDGISEVQNCTTSGCHDQTEPADGKRNINDPGNQKYYLAAYHKLCLYCHRDLKNERAALEKAGVTDESKLPAVGPTACAECHQ